jgi:hypothetical protein
MLFGDNPLNARMGITSTYYTLPTMSLALMFFSQKNIAPKILLDDLEDENV